MLKIPILEAQLQYYYLNFSLFSGKKDPQNLAKLKNLSLLKVLSHIWRTLDSDV